MLCPAIEGWDNYSKSLANFYSTISWQIINDPLTEDGGRVQGTLIHMPLCLNWWGNTVAARSVYRLIPDLHSGLDNWTTGRDVEALVPFVWMASCSETIAAEARLRQPFKSAPVSNSCTLKKKEKKKRREEKKIPHTFDTVWDISKPYHCLHSVHDRSLNRNAHWQKPEARRLPHFPPPSINCTLLSRFTANFCQLQCSLSAKMWVRSFVLRGMMQPSCNTKQIMLLATEELF